MGNSINEIPTSSGTLLKNLIWILFSIFGIIALKWWTKHRKIVKELELLPGFRRKFPFGNLDLLRFPTKISDLPVTVYIQEKITSFCLMRHKEGMYILWFAHIPTINVYAAEFMELILNNSAACLKSAEYKFFKIWLGDGLLISEGQKWKNRRKILTPAFHFKILETFIPVFNEKSEILVNKLYSFESEVCPDITPLIIHLTLDIVAESVMGVNINSQDDSTSEYVQALHDIAEIIPYREVNFWLRSDLLFYMTPKGRRLKKTVKILHSFAERVIRQREEIILKKLSETQDTAQLNDKNGKINYRKKPFLELLLDMHINQQILSKEEIREEVDTFMFGGHDTTAMVITWTLYCIGLYPHVQQKLIEELESIFDTDKNRPVLLEDLKQMKYMECTIKESQRIYPSVPIIGRRLSDDIKINCVTVPKGTTVHCFIYMLHRDPKEFPNPEIFDPDRFLPEATQNRHPYAYIPFAAGPRNCLGQKYAMMEIKIVIANVLRHFEIASLDPRDKIPVAMELVLRPAKAIRMKFIPRESHVY